MARSVLLMLLLTSLLLSACGESNPSPTPSTTATPTAVTSNPVPTPTAASSGFGAGWISGRVSYANGKPLTNQQVQVVIRGTTGAGANTYFELQADDRGHYEQKVPDGLYEIKAHITALYKGRTYGLWLDPIDGIDTPSQYSGNDIIKDFVWKLSGATPAAKTAPNSPHSYYGGVVEVGNDAEFEMQYNNGHLIDPHKYPAGSLIRLTLTPDGPLMDGTGNAVEREIDPQKLTDAILSDIPLGDYNIKAILIEENGFPTDLQVATIIPGGKIGDPVKPAESAPIIFKPESFGSFGFQSVALYVLPK